VIIDVKPDQRSPETEHRSPETEHRSPETKWERVLELIIRQCEPAEVLGALCLLPFSEEAGRYTNDPQIAFFTPGRASWVVSATSRLNPLSAAALARVNPDSLSATLLSGESSTRDGAAFADGWGRNLYSGVGEVLGFVLCFAVGPFEPFGDFSRVLGTVCRLAGLALEQRNLRDELTWQSDHDSVTGLYTQTCFVRMLASHMQAARTGVAMLHINLDRFRLVNDVLGHAVGNRILKFVGHRFRDCLEPEELLARAGGDEFVVLLRHGPEPYVTETANRLLQTLAEPISVDDHQVFISVSIGISLAANRDVDPGASPSSLQSNAYVALYHAKKRGKARWVMFEPSMAATPPERLETEKCLRSALARNEMLLYYQPQLDLATGQIKGVEALLRWNPAGLGIISPGSFIPILEETGLIVEFGRWVLREACFQGRRWLDANGIPLRIGVNVSAVQLRDPGFVTDVRNALHDSGYPAAYLELELTESTFIGGFETARLILRELQSLGVSFAIDDFGTGQSSLSYLQELPFQRLKIDQSFVRSIVAGERCHPVIENIVSMAKGLGMSTIAEGLDRDHHAGILRAVGCDEGQGYVFSHPLPPNDFLKFWSCRLITAD
jgi:diguanylate cyclase (GGDEF)-like protein